MIDVNIANNTKNTLNMKSKRTPRKYRFGNQNLISSLGKNIVSATNALHPMKTAEAATDQCQSEIAQKSGIAQFVTL